MHFAEEEIPRSGDRGRGEINARGLAQRKAGLGADKLRTEQFTLARASAELSVAEKNQMPRNATLIETAPGIHRGRWLFRDQGSVPNRRAEDHQHHRSNQPQPAAQLAPRVVSFDQYMESRMIGKLSSPRWQTPAPP